MRRISILVGCLLAFVGLPMLPASAALITFNLNTEFSGGTPPAGPAPWVIATFEDVEGSVRLTISAANLTGGEFISGFYFNFNPSRNAGSYLPSVSGTGTQTAYNSIAAGDNLYKADGDGFFDFYIDFPPPPGTTANKFTAGETFILTWAAGTGLTAADFNYASVNGPAGKTGFLAAAHVQGIAPDCSGWIAPGAGGSSNGSDTCGTRVPEPSALILLGVGLGLMGFVARRRKQQGAAA